MEKFLISAMLTIGLWLHAQVGIQISTPDLNSDLTLGSPNKGLLLNRVALKNTSTTNPLSENTPAGMLVYNTQTTSDLSPGIYVYDSKDWGEVNVKTPTHGTRLTKIKYRGRSIDPPTLKVPNMNMEFRFYPEAIIDHQLQFRLLTPPKEQVTYAAAMLMYNYSSSDTEILVFTPENYNLWQTSPYFNYRQEFWGILVSTNAEVIPGSNNLKAGVFYGFNELPYDPDYIYNPDSMFHILAFDSY